MTVDRHYAAHPEDRGANIDDISTFTMIRERLTREKSVARR